MPSYNGELFEFAPLATTPTNSFAVVTGAVAAAVGIFEALVDCETGRFVYSRGDRRRDSASA